MRHCGNAMRDLTVCGAVLTEFMDLLAKHLLLFVRTKCSQDPYWRSLKVVLSDASAPGEVRPNDVVPAAPCRSSHDETLCNDVCRVSIRSWSSSGCSVRSQATTPTCATSCTAWTLTSSCLVRAR